MGDSHSTADDTIDVSSIGETMAVFVSDHPRHTYRLVAGGAESNTMVGLASLGVRTQWVSKMGDDWLGGTIADMVAERGVDIDVIADRSRPTGIMTVTIADGVRNVTYHRAGSAASTLGVDDIERLRPSRWIHLTGVTCAISASGARLVDVLTNDRRSARVSFDVNLRPALWPSLAEAALTLVPIAEAADLVFVGDDEAEALFGTTDAHELAGIILTRQDQELVLKRGAGPASVVRWDSITSQDAAPTAVVEATGAGDAFAAGFLAGTVWGWEDAERLRLGHILAARVVAVLDHVVPPLTATELTDLLLGARPSR